MANLWEVAKKNPFHSPVHHERQLSCASAAGKMKVSIIGTEYDRQFQSHTLLI